MNTEEDWVDRYELEEKEIDNARVAEEHVEPESVTELRVEGLTDPVRVDIDAGLGATAAALGKLDYGWRSLTPEHHAALETWAPMVFSTMTALIQEYLRHNGFDGPRTVPEMLVMLHSEVSEALEEWRTFGDVRAHSNVLGRSDGSGETIAKPVGVPAELVDVLIRLLDTAARWNIDLWAEFQKKMAYNWTRPYQHGGRTL